MKHHAIALTVFLGAACMAVSVSGALEEEKNDWQDEFDMKDCTLSSTGKNPFFILEPGYQIVLGKKEGDETEQVLITVLDETETVDGVETRVVEEREFENGELKEVSRNFFAICAEHNDVFYFGEDVDDYKDGKVTGHGGAWRAGVDGGRAGMIMPGAPRKGMKHYQEVAPKVAMDRAEILALDAVLDAPGGSFTKCLKVVETSPLEPGSSSNKMYAPGVGMILDEDLVLIRHGKAVEGPIELPETAEMIETEIEWKDLPSALAEKVEALHPKGEIKEVKRETHPVGRIVYAIEIMVDGKQHDVEITPEGEVIRNEAE